MLWWLRRQLKSKSFQKQINALSKLSESKNPHAVSLLTSVLTDPMLMANAAHALGNLGDKSAIKALTIALKNTTGVWEKIEVARALWRLGDSQGVKSLIEVLTQPNEGQD